MSDTPLPRVARTLVFRDAQRDPPPYGKRVLLYAAWNRPDGTPRAPADPEDFSAVVGHRAFTNAAGEQYQAEEEDGDLHEAEWWAEIPPLASIRADASAALPT